MSFFEHLGSFINPDHLQRLASGQSDFSDPNSPDQQNLQQMFSRSDPNQLQQAFTHTAQQMNPQQYAEHITPGVNGTNPLGSLGGGALSTIASLLLNHLSSGMGQSPAGLLRMIPGLQTTDPNQMDANQVAALSSYTQQNHPDLFGRVAAQLGQEQPSLLSSFLGQGALSQVASTLASRFLRGS